MNIGTIKNGSKINFKVWAPLKKSISLHILSPLDKTIPMEKDENGYWNLTLEDFSINEYKYTIDNTRDRPDPVSFYQPNGVHEASAIFDQHEFKWTDNDWVGIPLKDMNIYELHVGTFTKDGTFESIIERLDDLKDIGINSIEIMPVSQFPGNRNWGYDGVYPFAVQNSYGGPNGLKKLVNACHEKGIALILDVVYNHLGPEGNYIWDFAPYFTDKYKTPWGWALNFDGEYSNEVRKYFISNVIYWFEYFHFDALRLDAIHGIFDFSAKHILKEMSEEVVKYSKEKNRDFYLIAESDLNDSQIIDDTKSNGYGIHAQWNDDFHHSLHALFTSEKIGYYKDFGLIKNLEKCIQEGYVYSGQYSKYRKRNHGNCSKHIQGNKFIIFSQNHDQIGNRINGERLSSLVAFNELKLAAGMTILSQSIPLLFMGEEYGESAPFLYFISHTNEHLIKEVREGRKKEFASFGWEKEPPDPYDSKTFEQCILKWDERNKGQNEVLLNFYKKLFDLRKTIPIFSNYSKNTIRTSINEHEKIIFIHRFQKDSEIFIIAHFSQDELKRIINMPEGKWLSILNSYDSIWNGVDSSINIKSTNTYEITFPGFGFILFEKQKTEKQLI